MHLVNETAFPPFQAENLCFSVIKFKNFFKGGKCNEYLDRKFIRTESR